MVAGPSEQSDRFRLQQEAFEMLARLANELQSMLIPDCTFRSHCKDMMQWDMYGLLEELQVSYVIIEDTGQTWQLHDLKVGITTCSPDLTDEIHRLHDQLLLNVSPFTLHLLLAMVCDSQNRGLEETIWRVIDKNRELVRAFAERTQLEIQGDSSGVPVELLAPPGLAYEFWIATRAVGVDILPAQNYCWSNSRGRQMFRVPLSRPNSQLEEVRRAVLRLY
jgi:aspartate/methionine/tyrosine aminotransferase